MKTKDETIKVVKQWYSYIADLRVKHKLVVFMSDNAGEKKYKKVKEFFEFVGVHNTFGKIQGNQRFFQGISRGPFLLRYPRFGRLKRSLS